MILKCIEGPMDGAVYSLDRSGKNTTRKPDGLWFDAQEPGGHWVQHQYGFDRLAEGGDHVTMMYRFGGSIPLLIPGEIRRRVEQTHGCKSCGEERPPRIVSGKLTCPECGSENLVCIE